MASDLEDFCDVWPVPCISPADESRDAFTFSIDVRVSFIHPPPEAFDEDELDISSWEETTWADQTFEVERELLMHDDDTSRSTLEEKLMALHVPFQPFMIDRILKCARDMARMDPYKSRKVLRMFVDIIATVFSSEQEVLVDEATNKMVPASESAIERLETIKIEDNESTGSCAVCLEEIPVGSQAKRMPCAHRFHGDCIVNWLNKSIFCPLCRFELL